MTKRNLDRAVVVVTGASSGIGRATALEFARRGALLALAARDDEALADVAAECALEGGRAITVPTDVTNPAAVKYLAESAARTYGRIDIWVNNAGAGALGGFTETPVEVHDQIIRTNLMGYLHGAYAVMPLFKQQHEGILINNISFGAWFPAPYAVAYAASKYGVLGFSEALRAEYQDYPQIHVCNVFPSFINTPGINRHSANYTGHRIGGAATAADPHKVALAILALAQSPRDEITVGALASLARVSHRLSPRLSGWVAARATESSLNSSEPAPPTAGALFQSGDEPKGIYGADPQPRFRAQLAAAGAAVVLGFMATRWLRPKLANAPRVSTPQTRGMGGTGSRPDAAA